MTSSLAKGLVLPLLIALAAAIVIHQFWNADGFFINAATELAGILVTVLYVDWVLRKHEHLSWSPTKSRIDSRVRIFISGVVTNLRTALGIGIDVFNPATFPCLDEKVMHEEVLRVATHVMKPQVAARIGGFEQHDWKKFERAVQASLRSTQELIATFQLRLTPEQMPLLLDLEEALSRSLTLYTTFPDVLGVPDDKLPSQRKSLEDVHRFQAEAAEITARDIVRGLDILPKLSSVSSTTSC